MRYGVVEIDEIKDKRKKWIIYIFLTVFALGCFIYTFMALRVENISVVGNAYYSEEEVKSWVFDSASKNYILYLWMSEKINGHDEIPFVDRYEVNINGSHSVKITVYEKDVIACFEQMGTYMFFNSAGVLLECGSEPVEGIPVISGVPYDSAVLYERIEVRDLKILSEIDSIVQILDRNGLNAEKIHFDTSQNPILYIGSIKVVLGGNSDRDGQVMELVNILPKLEGRTGTLDLTYFKANGNNSSYPFMPD